MEKSKMIRVISGKAKNKKLLVKEGTTRPLTDRIKVSLFDLIRDYIDDAKVLDLFCGSGSFGIEALSRGANFVHFVDIDEEVINILNQNLINTDFKNKSAVLNMSATDFLLQNKNKFNLVFIDPPFTHNENNTPEILSLIGKHISETAVVIVRIRHSINLPNSIKSNKKLLKKIYQKRYGKSTLMFYKH